MKIYDYDGKKNISGQQVYEARTQKHMTQSDLAARLQTEGVIIERDSISKIESGRRFVADYEVVVLAKVLGVSALWLLGDEKLDH